MITMHYITHNLRSLRRRFSQGFSICWLYLEDIEYSASIYMIAGAIINTISMFFS